jgi:hypothetical protein
MALASRRNNNFVHHCRTNSTKKKKKCYLFSSLQGNVYEITISVITSFTTAKKRRRKNIGFKKK